MDSKRFLSVVLSLFLPNLPCSLRTSFFSDLFSVIFPESQKDSPFLCLGLQVTFHVMFIASTDEGGSRLGLTLCCMIAGTDVHTLLLPAR